MVIGFTLGRYLSRRFLGTIMAVFGTVLALIVTIDFVELMRRAGDAEGASAQTMALLSFLRAPSLAEQVLPFAVLFGAIAALLSLSRKLELVVARAAGVSAWEFLQPGVFVALMVGVVSVAVYNPVSAYMKQRAAEIEARIFAKSTKFVSGKDLWIRQRSIDGQAIIRAESGLEQTATLIRPTVFGFDQAGSFRERIEARQAKLHDGYWELTDARVTSVIDEPQSDGTYLVATTLQPDQVRRSFTPAESVPFWSLGEVIEQTERAGLDATRYRLHQAVLMARPLLLIAMVFVAASVSLRFFRSGGVSRRVFGGIVAGFMLYVATELMQDFGTSGLVGPQVAAWLPAVVGSLLGTLALLYQEDG